MTTFKISADPILHVKPPNRLKTRSNFGLEREHERWSREDALRTFEHKRIAYIEFVESLRKMNKLVGDATVELPDDWYHELLERAKDLRLWVSPEVADWADLAVDATMSWGASKQRETEKETGVNFRAMARDAEWKLVAVIREELGVPAGNPDYDGRDSTFRDFMARHVR